MAINDTIRNNQVGVKTGDQDQLVTELIHIFGTTKVAICKNNAIQLVYDLKQKVFRGGILPLDLETGGPDDDTLPNGKKNWFPGATTYGVIVHKDAPVFITEPDGTAASIGRANIKTTVYKVGPGHNFEDSVIKILTVLDAVNTDPRLKQNLYYYIETSGGIRGYVAASAVDKIVYKVAD